MMSFSDEVLAEARRLGILFYIARTGTAEPPNTSSLSSWLGIDSEMGHELVRGLIEEGFVTPFPTDRDQTRAPLQLSSAGEGLLRYFKMRSQKEPARTRPKAIQSRRRLSTSSGSRSAAPA